MSQGITTLGLMKCRASPQGEVIGSLYRVTSFTLDDPGIDLSTTTLQRVVWRDGLQQLTLTHSKLPDAGMCGCKAMVQQEPTCVAVVLPWCDVRFLMWMLPA